MFSQGPLGREGENGIPGVDGLPVCLCQIQLPLLKSRQKKSVGGTFIIK